MELAAVGDRRILLDGAHNEDGARQLGQYIQKHLSGQPLTLVFGACLLYTSQQKREKQIGQCVEHATHQKAIQEGEKVADQREGARPDQEKGYAEGGEKALVGDGLTGRNAVIQMVAVKEGEKPDDHRRHTCLLYTSRCV